MTAAEQNSQYLRIGGDDGVADLPTRPYLTVFVQKSADSMDVRTYLSKYRQKVSRKYRNRDVNECVFVASEVVEGQSLMVHRVIVC